MGAWLLFVLGNDLPDFPRLSVESDIAASGYACIAGFPERLGVRHESSSE